ncbi:MAG: hypothetical protein FWG85_08190 [Bacteroidetes bacterium]|nr:hypothetical protein [Bacteroidota bacterium]
MKIEIITKADLKDWIYFLHNNEIYYREVTAIGIKVYANDSDADRTYVVPFFHVVLDEDNGGMNVPEDNCELSLDLLLNKLRAKCHKNNNIVEASNGE